jgi:mxaA protein
MPPLRVPSAALLGLIAIALFARAETESEVTVENPRAFGHFIGDRLERHIRMTVPRPYSLAQDGLPKLGRANAWVELTGTAAHSVPGLDGTQYRIDLIYQVVNSPAQARLTALPEVRMKFSASGKAFEEKIEEWPIGLAPLTPGGTGIAVQDIRPARVPTLIDGRPAEIRLTAYLAGAAALLGWLALARFGLPWLRHRNGPFAAAHRTLAKLSRRPADRPTFQSALRAVHRAFDQTAGVRLFPEQLDAFLSRHQQFADLRAGTQRFFDASSREFFGDGVDPDGLRLDWLLRLCADCRARERRA